MWIRFADEAPISVVKETSFSRIPRAFAFAVVSGGCTRVRATVAVRVCVPRAAPATAASVPFGSRKVFVSR